MSKRFDTYLYQIIPVWRSQIELFNEHYSEEELIKNKNKFFFAALKELVHEGQFKYRDLNVIHRVLYKDEFIMILQIGLNRGHVPIDNPDFTKEKLDTYPNLIIAFNNHPEYQYLFIEREYKAFRKTYTAADMLQSNLNDALNKYMLHVGIEPIFEEQDFWELVNKYPSIYYLEFEMIAPNLTNIHGAIEDNIKNWFPNTNSQKIDIEMNSDNKAKINVGKDVEPIRSFAEYASKGGGNINIKAKEVKHKISTKDYVIQVTCENLEINAEGDVSGIQDLISLLGKKVNDDEAT